MLIAHVMMGIVLLSWVFGVGFWLVMLLCGEDESLLLLTPMGGILLLMICIANMQESEAAHRRKVASYARKHHISSLDARAKLYPRECWLDPESKYGDIVP